VHGPSCTGETFSSPSPSYEFGTIFERALFENKRHWSGNEFSIIRNFDFVPLSPPPAVTNIVETRPLTRTVERPRFVFGLILFRGTTLLIECPKIRKIDIYTFAVYRTNISRNFVITFPTNNQHRALNATLLLGMSTSIRYVCVYVLGARTGDDFSSGTTGVNLFLVKRETRTNNNRINRVVLGEARPRFRKTVFFSSVMLAISGFVVFPVQIFSLKITVAIVFRPS